MKRLSLKTRSLFIALLLSTSLTACNMEGVKDEPTTKEVVKGDDVAQLPTNAVKQVSIRAKPMDSELLFNLLAGEFAGVRGQMSQSIDFYSTAAVISNEPEVISRAAYIALYAAQYELALELSERWLALKLPADMLIDRVRLISFLHLEQLNPVIEALKAKLIVKGKLQPSSLPPISRLLSKETSPQFAKEVSTRLHQEYPQEPFFLLLLAKFEANLSEYESALGHIDQLMLIDDDMADAYLIQAQIYAGLGQQVKALEAIEVVVNKRPEDAHLRLQYSRMLVQMKMFEKAITHFKVLQKAKPNDENVLLSLGLLSIEIDQNDNAKVYLQELLDNGYHNQQAHYYLGRIQQNDGEIMVAIANYDRVLNGEYMLDARIRAAGLLAKTGETDASLKRLESLSRGKQTDQSRVQVYLAKGEVLRSVSRHKEAYTLYNRALRQSPENTDLLYARALTAEKLDLLDVTESDLKMVIMHEPKNASALNALGYTLADRTSRLNEAREYILKAAQLLPDDPAILDSLGWVYFRLGEYENAIKWLSKAFDSLQDAEIAAHLGEALWMNGNMQKAQTIWKKGEKLNGNQVLLRATIERFKK